MKLLFAMVALLSVTVPVASAEGDFTLVAHYGLDSLTGGVALDDGGNDHHGAVYGPVTTGPGVIGDAYAPNGGQIYLELPTLDVSPGSKVTVALWMYWGGENSIMPFGFNVYDLWMVDGCFGFNSGNGDVYGIGWGGLAGRFVFVVAEFTNGNMYANKLWIDGVQQTLGQCRGGPQPHSITTSAAISGWRIGPGYTMTGQSRIDEVTVLNGVLTDDEVTTLMTTGTLTPPVPELPTLVLAGAGLAVTAMVVARRRRA